MQSNYHQAYQHFRNDEHPFIDSLYDWAQWVSERYAPYLTDFLNPRQHFIAESILGQYEDLEVNSWGGYEEAEQKRLLILPEYAKANRDDFKIQAFEIDYPGQFTQLSHGSILGSLLNIGLNREKFGDIISDGSRWQFFCDQDIADFVGSQVNRIGRDSVLLQPVDGDQVIENEDHNQIKDVVLSSLRLDVLISSAFNLSRSKSKEAIQADRIKINWTPIDNPATELSEYDIVSVRGLGRLVLLDIKGRSRKNNLLAQVKIYDSSK